VTREDILVKTFLELADTLVSDFDIVDVTQTLVERCFELFGAAAGVLISDGDGNLRVFSTSSDQLRIVELFEVQAHEGPCLDCYRRGLPVINQNLARARGQWTRFVPVALGAGFQSVHAVPIRLREQVVGALSVFRSDPGPLDPIDVVIAQGFADAIAIAILQTRALKDAQSLAGQLQDALDSRVLIEQAKGMLAERANESVSEAFIRLRRYARGHNEKLSAVSEAIVEGSLSLNELVH
jgi:GAF domain-containing protein